MLTKRFAKLRMCKLNTKPVFYTTLASIRNTKPIISTDWRFALDLWKCHVFTSAEIGTITEKSWLSCLEIVVNFVGALWTVFIRRLITPPHYLLIGWGELFFSIKIRIVVIGICVLLLICVTIAIVISLIEILLMI